MRIISIAGLLIALPAAAQDAPPFATVTLDQARYQQLDAALAAISMPRAAHIAVMNILQDLERQALIDARKPKEEPKP